MTRKLPIEASWSDIVSDGLVAARSRMAHNDASMVSVTHGQYNVSDN